MSGPFGQPGQYIKKKLKADYEQLLRVVFLCTGPDAQMTKKQKSRTTKSPLMQDWVFRLGPVLNFEAGKEKHN